MTVDEALAWANARMVDRWRMVKASFGQFEDGAIIADGNSGERYAQMDAEAMDVLAAEVVRLKAELAEARRLYHELLFEVARKYPGETRHETAQRYIRQAEQPQGGAGVQRKVQT